MDEYQIVEVVKDGYRTGSIIQYHNFLLNDKTIISAVLYEHSYQHNPSINKQVIGHVYNDITILVSELEFPMFIDWDFIPYAYLYKKGYLFTGYSQLGPAPLPNLKYNIYCVTGDTEHMSSAGYDFQDKLVIELVDVEVAATNLNLPKIVTSVLGLKLLSGNKMIEQDELDKIEKQMRSQKLFAGHTWDDAERIVSRYFNRNKRELLKEVLKISEAYQQVFRPYRVVYNTKTWELVLL